MGQNITYIDSNVIINAVNIANPDLSQKAFLVLLDPARKFLLGDYVKLETLPKMRYHKQQSQIEFTETLFANVENYISSSDAIVSEAENLAGTYGLSAMDALHAASAIAGGADELVTFEKPTKPFFRIPQEILKVVSLHLEANIL